MVSSSKKRMMNDESTTTTDDDDDFVVSSSSSTSSSSAIIRTHNNSSTVSHNTSDDMQPKPMDIVLGRGKAYLRHPGNVVFQEMIWTNRMRYFESSFAAKRSLIDEIIKKLQSQGGRFIRRKGGNHSTEWCIIPPSSCRLKIAHALQYHIRAELAQQQQLQQNQTLPSSSSSSSSSQPSMSLVSTDPLQNSTDSPTTQKTGKEDDDDDNDGDGDDDVLSTAAPSRSTTTSPSSSDSYDSDSNNAMPMDTNPTINESNQSNLCTSKSPGNQLTLGTDHDAKVLTQGTDEKQSSSSPPMQRQPPSPSPSQPQKEQENADLSDGDSNTKPINTNDIMHESNRSSHCENLTGNEVSRITYHANLLIKATDDEQSQTKALIQAPLHPQQEHAPCDSPHAEIDIIQNYNVVSPSTERHVKSSLYSNTTNTKVREDRYPAYTEDHYNLQATDPSHNHGSERSIEGLLDDHWVSEFGHKYDEPMKSSIHDVPTTLVGDVNNVPTRPIQSFLASPGQTCCCHCQKSIPVNYFGLTPTDYHRQESTPVDYFVPSQSDDGMDNSNEHRYYSNIVGPPTLERPRSGTYYNVIKMVNSFATNNSNNDTKSSYGPCKKMPDQYLHYQIADEIQMGDITPMTSTNQPLKNFIAVPHTNQHDFDDCSVLSAPAMDDDLDLFPIDDFAAELDPFPMY